MSFFTNLLETIAHFQFAIEEKELKLTTAKKLSKERLQLLVELAYCYAHVQLQKGVLVADEAIILAENLSNQAMKANALCAKAMNEFRIGYIARAHISAQQALSIFENINDEEGRCDAYFQLGSLPYLSIGWSDTAGYLKQALSRYISAGNKTGVYLSRIQQTLQLFLDVQFEEGFTKIKALIKELSAPHQHHLLCFANMQLSLGIYIKQDVVQFKDALLTWQKLAEANGNFHDYCMTKALLADCYRLQHIDKDAMQACLDSIEYCDELGSIHGHSTVAIVMATICISQGHYTDALLYIQKSIVATLEIKDDYKYLMSLNIMGEVYLKLGQIDEARETFQTVQHEAKLNNDRLNRIAAHRHLAELANQQGEFDQALFDFKVLCDDTNNSDYWNMQDNGNYAFSIAKSSDAAMCKAGLKPEDRNTLRHQYLKKHLEFARKQQNEREEARALNNLAEYYEEINDLNTAIRFQKKYIKLYEKIINEENINNMTNLRIKYETEKKEQEIMLLKKENEEALLNERFRISRELHDDIGTTLGSISIYSEVAKSHSKKNEKVEEVIDKIGTASRELIDKMSDIVWSINPGNDNFKNLSYRMHNYAASMLGPREIEFDFNINDELKASFNIKERKNIFLIFKECIYNISKYAECRQVNIILNKKNNFFQMKIQDDGRGFEMNKSNTYNGNGIINIMARAAEIKAMLNITSTINTGTCIEIILPC